MDATAQAWTHYRDHFYTICLHWCLDSEMTEVFSLDIILNKINNYQASKAKMVVEIQQVPHISYGKQFVFWILYK